MTRKKSVFLTVILLLCVGEGLLWWSHRRAVTNLNERLAQIKSEERDFFCGVTTIKTAVGGPARASTTTRTASAPPGG